MVPIDHSRIALLFIMNNNMPIRKIACLSLLSSCLVSCWISKQDPIDIVEDTFSSDSVMTSPSAFISAADIRLRKEILFDQYTLEDHYIYVNNKKDTIERLFQWDKVKQHLASLENIRNDAGTWAVLQNYKNWNGESPEAHNSVSNSYGRISDSFGVERYQSVALYLPLDTLIPERYGRDGTPVKLLSPVEDSTSTFFLVDPIPIGGQWLVQKRHVKVLGDTIRFDRAVFVDVTNQSIASLENKDGEWLIRSMNPATTGVHRPPYSQETPLGIFFIQDKKRKMLYLRDGSQEMGGFAPYASRFTNGAYMHGVPTVHPGTYELEYSRSLGTTPRSHMCVRNASSHAKFIYEQFPVFQTVVFVID